MSIENIIENSYDIVSNYFIEEQKKRDDQNRNKLLSDLTKSIKNGLIKELNGEELFTKDYKKDYFNKIKEMFIYLHGNKHKWRGSRFLQRSNNNNRINGYGGGRGIISYDNPEELFSSYFSEILKKIDTDEYIIGLYGMMDDYIIVFTNKLNIITYYNEKGPISGKAPYWNASSGKTEGPKLGLHKENNNLLLNDLQIDLIQNLFNRLYFLNGIIISTKIKKDIYTPSQSYVIPIKEYLMYCVQNWGNYLPDYYLYYRDIVNHIVYMFKTYWTGKFLSPYAKEIELENIKLNEIHNTIYQERIYLKQKEELDNKINEFNEKKKECDDRISTLNLKIIKEKEINDKNSNLESLQIVLKEKGKKIREIQNENKQMLDEVKKIESNIKLEQTKLDNKNKELLKNIDNFKKEKEHFEKYRKFLLEQDI
jgi:hypothetical protein